MLSALVNSCWSPACSRVLSPELWLPGPTYFMASDHWHTVPNFIVAKWDTWACDHRFQHISGSTPSEEKGNRAFVKFHTSLSAAAHCWVSCYDISMLPTHDRERVVPWLHKGKTTITWITTDPKKSDVALSHIVHSDRMWDTVVAQA